MGQRTAEAVTQHTVAALPAGIQLVSRFGTLGDDLKLELMSQPIMERMTAAAQNIKRGPKPPFPCSGT